MEINDIFDTYKSILSDKLTTYKYLVKNLPSTISSTVERITPKSFNASMVYSPSSSWKVSLIKSVQVPSLWYSVIYVVESSGMYSPSIIQRIVGVGLPITTQVRCVGFPCFTTVLDNSVMNLGASPVGTRVTSSLLSTGAFSSEMTSSGTFYKKRQQILHNKSFFLQGLEKKVKREKY
jgi:hypothetical protein